MFVTERPGRIRVVEDGGLVEEPWARLRVPRASFAEAGLMGLALDPDFETNGRLYVCHSYYLDEQGRIRDVEQGPEGFLYITTSNRDGRGRPRQGDDRILKIVPPR